MGFSLIPSRPFPFTLERHAKAKAAGETVPVFRLRYLGSRMFSELLDMMKSDPARAFHVVVATGLVGWDHVERDGEPFAFEAAAPGKRLVNGHELEGGASPACVDALPYEVVVELAGKIIEANQLDKDSVKN